MDVHRHRRGDDAQSNTHLKVYQAEESGGSGGFYVGVNFQGCELGPDRCDSVGRSAED